MPPPVEPVLQVDRQAGQVGVVSGQYDVVHRSVRRRHLDRGNGVAKAFAQGSGKAGLVGIERGCEAAPGPDGVRPVDVNKALIYRFVSTARILGMALLFGNSIGSSLVITGASLVPVMSMVSVAVEVAPWASCMV